MLGKLINKNRIDLTECLSLFLTPFQFVLNASTNFSLCDLSKITLVENTQLYPASQLASLYSSGDYWGISKPIMLETNFDIYEDKTIGKYWRSLAP